MIRHEGHPSWVVELTGEELEETLGIQLKHWTDWPARFSCNMYREVWPTSSWGRSDPDSRIHVDEVPLLAEITDRILHIRPSGGRFFVCEHGAWVFDDSTGGKLQIVEFALLSRPRLPVICSQHGGAGGVTAGWKARLPPLSSALKARSPLPSSLRRETTLLQ
jgi:hypothetical protein